MHEIHHSTETAFLQIHPDATFHSASERKPDWNLRCVFQLGRCAIWSLGRSFLPVLLLTFGLLIPFSVGPAESKFTMNWDRNNSSEIRVLTDNLTQDESSDGVLYGTVDFTGLWPARENGIATARYEIGISEKLNGSGWTSSSTVFSNRVSIAPKSFLRCNREQLPDFNVSSAYEAGTGDIPAKFGFVFVQNFGNPTSIAYCPNMNELKKLAAGDKIHVRITFTYQRRHKAYDRESDRNGTLYLKHTEKHLDIYISKSPIVQMSFNEGKHELSVDSANRSIITINSDKFSTYDDIVGEIDLNANGLTAASVPTYASSEILDSGIVTKGNNLNTRDAVPEWTGWEKPSGDNLTYGTWFMSKNFNRLMFRPNSEAINSLVTPQVITSTLQLNWVSSDPNSRKDLGFLQVIVKIKIPQLSLSIESKAAPVNEGMSAKFAVTANANPQKAVNLKFYVINRYNSTDQWSVQTVPLNFERDISSGIFSATLEIPTNVNHDNRDFSGEITVVVIEGEGYHVELGGALGTVAVYDSNIPILTIQNSPDTSAGDIAEFPVSTRVDPGRKMTVSYKVMETSSNFLDTGCTGCGESGEIRTKSLTFFHREDSDEYVAILPVQSVRRQNHELGEITVELLEDTTGSGNYAISMSKLGVSREKSTVTITNNPAPHLSITSLQQQVREGDVANLTFAVTAKYSVRRNLRVNYVVEEYALSNPNGPMTVHNFIGQIPSQVTLVFNRSTTATFSIPIVDDDVREEDREIRVTLMEDNMEAPEYTVSTLISNRSGNSATVLVRDDDSLTDIRISTEFQNVVPGSDFMFTVTAEHILEDAVSFTVKAVDGLSNPLVITPSELVIPAGSDSVTGRVTTTDGLVADLGMAVVTVSPVEKQELVLRTASISLPFVEPEFKQYVSVQAVSTSVVEGEQAEFRLTVSSAPVADLMVRIFVSDLPVRTGDEPVDYVNEGDIYVRIPANTSELLFTVPTKGNTSIDSDGVMVAILQLGVGYNTGSLSTIAAKVEVRDKDGDEPPTVTVSEDSSTIIEGHSARFTLTRTGPTVGVLTVGYALQESGEVTTISTHEQTIDIPDGSSTVTVDLPTIRDDAEESADAGLMLRIRGLAEYSEADYRIGVPSVAKVGVVDKLPELSIETDYDSVVPGAGFSFSVLSSHAPSQDVNFSVIATDGSSNELTVTPSTLVLLAGNASVTGRVETVAGDSVDLDGVSLTIDSGDGTDYSVSAQNLKVPFINPTNVPMVAISTVEANVIEGSPVEFRLTADSAPDADLTIRVSISDVAGRSGSDVVDEGVHYVRLAAMETTITFSVPTKDDSTDEPDGILEAAVGSNPGYVLGGESTVRTEVFDNDGPEVPQVTVSAIAPTITVGDTARFRLTRRGSTSGELTVEYELLATDEITSANTGRLTKTIPDGESHTDVEVATISGDLPESEDTGLAIRIISPRENPAVGYRVGLQSIASIGISDQLPQLAISTNYTSVVPGSSITFTIRSDPAPSENLPLTLQALDGTSNSLQITPSPFVFPAGEGLVTGRVTTLDGDPLALNNLQVEIASGDGSSYMINTGSMEVAFSKADIEPILTIEGPSTPVDEGDRAVFQVKADPLPSADLTVRIAVADLADRGGADFVIERDIFIRLPANTDIVTIDVPTENDQDPEPDGVVRAELYNDPGYRVGAKSSAIVEVYDGDGNEPATVMVTTSTPLVVEGDTVDFTLTRTGSTAEELSVGYVLIETGEVTDETTGIGIAAIPSGEESVTISVETVRDAEVEKEADGLTMRVRSPVEYHPATYRSVPNSHAEAVVKERLSVLTLSTKYDSIIPGGGFKFTVTANPAPLAALPVILSAVDGLSNTLLIEPNVLEIAAGAESVSGLIKSRVGNPAELGKVTVSAVERDGPRHTYAVESISVPFSLTGAEPILTLQGPETAIDEGNEIGFKLIANKPVSWDLMVEVNISDSAERIGADYVEETSILLRLPANATEQVFTVPTRNDSTNGPDGLIIAEIISGTGYALGAQSTIHAEVLDTDGEAPPIVSVSTASASVNEGEQATFILSRTSPATDRLRVVYELSQTGNVTKDEIGVLELEFEPGQLTHAVNIITVPDSSTLPPDAGLNLRIRGSREFASARYRVGSNSSAAISVSNILPVLSISTDYSSVALGGKFRFTVTAVPAPSEPLSVGIYGTVATDSLITSPDPFVLPAGGEMAVLSGWGDTKRLRESNLEVEILPSWNGEFVLGTNSFDIPIIAPTSVPSMVIEGPSSPVDEGESAVLTLTVDEETNFDKSVRVSVADLSRTGADFVAERDYLIRLPAHQTSVEFSVPTMDDSLDEWDDEFVVTLRDEAGYSLGNKSSAVVEVLDDDGGVPPVVTVRTEGTQVVEGGLARFILSRDGSDYGDLNVSYELVESGNATSEPTGDFTTSIPKGRNSVIVEVQTEIDADAEEPDASLVLRIRRMSENSDARYRLGDSSEARIDIVNGLPALNIRTSYSSVVPGADFTVTVRSDPAPLSTLSVPITAVDSNGGTLSIVPSIIEIPANANSASGRVTTLSGSAGTVTVTASSDGNNRYTLANHGFSIPLRSPAIEPELSISTGSHAPMTEGNVVRFDIQSNRPSDSDLTVGVSVFDLVRLDGGDFVTEAVHYVRLPVGATETSLSIFTVNDEIQEPDGLVSALLIEGNGYSVGTREEARVVIQDDDGDLPQTVNVSAETVTVVEGIDVVFTLSRTGDDTNPLSVSYELTEIGEVTNETVGVGIVVIPANSSEVTLHVPTVRDAEIESVDNGLNLKILGLSEYGDAEYRVGADSQVKVSVSERLSILKISSEFSSVLPGGSFTFTVSANPPPLGSLPLTISVVDGALNSLLVTPSSFEIAAGESSATGLVATIPDIDTSLGLATVAIGTGDGTRYSLETGSISIPFDSPTVVPTLTISGPSEPIVEGGIAEYAVTADSMPGVDLAVRVSVAGHIGNSNEPQNVIVKMAANDTHTSFSIKARYSEVEEFDGLITATIQKGEGYAVGAPSTVTSAVVNNDGMNLPIVTVTAPSQPITEGETAIFTIIRTGSTAGELLVNYDLTETGDVTVEPTGTLTVVIPDGSESVAVEVGTVQGHAARTSDASLELRIRELTENSEQKYSVGIPGSVRVGVLILPELTIETPYTSVVPGSEFSFSVSSSHALHADLTLQVTAVDTAGKSQVVSPSIFEFHMGSSFMSGRVSTFKRSTGMVTLTLSGDDTRFILSVPQISVPFIAPSRLPELSIMLSSAPLNEGETIEFTISTNHPPNTDLAAGISVYDYAGHTKADFVTESSHFVRLPANTTDVRVSIPTVNDEVDESDGFVFARLVEGAGYIIGANSSARAEVRDNDGTSPPNVTVVASQVSIPEGDTAVFKLFRSGSNIDPLQVEYLLSEIGEVTDEDLGVGTVEFAAGVSEVEISVSTVVDDELETSNSGLNLSVRGMAEFDGALYRVDGNSMAKVAVSEKYLALTITKDYDSVVPGSVFKFTVTSTPAPRTVLPLVLTAEDGASNMLTVTPTIFEIGAGMQSASGWVRTVAGDDSELGMVRVSIAEGDGTRFRLATGSVSIPFRTPDIEPVLSIAGPQVPVDEGDTIEFTITADRPSDLELTVQVSLSELSKQSGTDFIDEEDFYIRLPANRSTVSFSVPTVADNDDGMDGVIVAELLEGAGYSLGLDSRVYVDVYDEDGNSSQIVSVKSTSDSIVEGDMAMFTISRTGSGADELIVGYELMETGEVTNEATGPLTVTIPKDVKSVDVLVATVQDSEIETLDAALTVRIRSIREYTEAAYRTGAEDSAMVAVIESKPVIAISTNNTSVADSDYFDVLVTMDPAPEEDSQLPVVLSIDDGPGNSALHTSVLVLFHASETEKQVRINLNKGGVHNTTAGDSVVVSVQQSAHYEVESSQAMVEVTVMDGASLPEVVVDAPDSVVEGNSFAVTVTALNVPESSNEMLVPVVATESTGSSRGYLSSQSVQFVAISTAESSATLTVATNENALNASEGSIKVSILPGANYKLGASVNDIIAVKKRQTFTTLAVPTINIVEAPVDAVLGEPVKFKVNATPKPTTPMEVDIQIFSSDANSADTLISSSEPPMSYVKGNAGTIEIPVSGELEVIAHTVKPIEGGTGTITARLNLKNPEAYVLGSKSEVTVKMRSPLQPEADILIVELAGPKSTVRAGESAQFTVSASHMPSGPIEVRYTVSSKGNFVAPVIDINSVQLLSLNLTETNTMLRIPTQDGGANEGGTITVTLHEGTGYALGKNSSQSTSVNGAVNRVHSREVISIEAVTDSLIEGHMAEFRIWSSDSGSDAVVNFSVAQQGENMFMPVENKVSLLDGSKILRIPTLRSEDAKQDRSITVTIHEGDYDLGSSSATVGVTTGAKVKGVNPVPLYSVASTVIKSILLNIGLSDESGTNPRIDALPAISIEKESTLIEEGAMAVFSLNASKTVENPISVNLVLEQEGDFIDGDLEMPVLIESGSRSTVVSVLTVDDNFAESDGSVTAVIAGGTGYAVSERNRAMIAVSDASDRGARQIRMNEVNRKVLSNMSILQGSHTQDTVAERVAKAFANGSGSEFELGGDATFQDLLETGGNFVNDGMDPWQEVLDDSSFTFGLFPEEELANVATVWGRGDLSELIRVGDSDIKGEQFTGQFGIDAIVGNGLVAGLAASMSRMEADYNSGYDAMALQTRSTGLHHYFGFESTDKNKKAHFTTGYGVSEIVLNQQEYEPEILDTEFFSIGLGGNGTVFSSKNLLSGGTSELNINGNTWYATHLAKSRNEFTGGLQSDALNVSVSVEGSHIHEIRNGAKLTYSMASELSKVAMSRQSSLISGTGLSYEDPTGIEISGSGEAELDNKGHFQAWEIAGQFSFDAGYDKMGTVFEITPELQQRDAIAENLNGGSSTPIRVFDSDSIKSDFQVGTEIGYGLTIWDGYGKLFLNSGMELTNAQNNAYRLGSELEIGSDMEFEVQGTRSFKDFGLVEDEIELRGRVNW